MKTSSGKIQKIINSIIIVATIHYLIYALLIRILLNFDANDMIVLGTFSQYIILIILIPSIIFVAKITRLRKHLIPIKLIATMAFLYQLLYLLSGELNNWMLQISSSVINFILILSATFLLITLNNMPCKFRNKL